MLLVLLKSDSVSVTQGFDFEHGPPADWMAPQLPLQPGHAQPSGGKKKSRKQLQSGGQVQHTWTPRREDLPMLSDMSVHMLTNRHFASSFVMC